MLQLKTSSKNIKIAVLGYGKEWKSSLDFLLSQGFSDITILDKNNDIWDIPENITYILGPEYLRDLSVYEVIIKSPWVSPYKSELASFRDKFISQTQIFFEYYRWNVIGITGTKWKSTVSSLLHASLLEAWYKSKLVGNIWSPVLDEIDIINWEKHDYVVYELSSYMLEDFCPKLYIWYINNIFECHLDWHENMWNYSSAKMNILINAENTVTHNTITWWEITFPSKTWFDYENSSLYYNWEIFLTSPVKHILWEHNMENICWVLSILRSIIDDENKLKSTIQNTLSSFHSLPHRLENIWVFHDITFIDDWAAVTPEATISAIKALGPDVETLLVWWKDLQADYTNLEKTISESNIKNIVLFPDSWYRLFSMQLDSKKEDEVFEFSLANTTLKCIKTRSMESAIKFSYRYTSPGKIVLLSSAAQSYSLWKSFEEKWDQFKKFIKKHETV